MRADPEKFLYSFESPRGALFWEVSSEVSVKGWAVGLEEPISQLVVKLGGGIEVWKCIYGLKRPDVQSVFPHVAGAEDSGFEVEIPAFRFAEAAREKSVRMVIEARCGTGDFQKVCTHEVPVYEGLPAHGFFEGCLNAFEQPTSFVRDELPRWLEDEPVFVVGTEARLVWEKAWQIQREMDAKIPVQGSLFPVLRELHVAASNSWHQYFWSDLPTDQEILPKYGIGHFPIKEICNNLLKMGRTTSGAWIETMSGTQSYSILPLLAWMFPRARFVSVERSARGVACDIVTAWKRFAEREGTGRASSEEPFDSEGQEDDTKEYAPQFNGEAGILAEARTKWWRFEGVPAMTEERPVFIVGAGRSGTSAMVSAMYKAGIRGWHEGHVFPFVVRLLDAFRKTMEEFDAGWGHLHPTKLDRNKLAALVADAVHRASRSSFVVGDRWLDKTPDARMLDCLDLVLALYPAARFIYLRRHPLPWIVSRQQKFDEAFELSCVQWTRCQTLWTETVQNRLHPNQFEAFDQKEFSGNVESVVERLVTLLDLDVDAGKAIRTAFSRVRTEFSGGGRSLRGVLSDPENLSPSRAARRATLYGRIADAWELTLPETGWTEEQKRFFLENCGECATALGYELFRCNADRTKHITKLAIFLDEYIEEVTREHREGAAKRWWARIHSSIGRVIE